MRDVDKALADISVTRDQIARQTVFYGYGPATMIATGGLAFLVAVAQSFQSFEGSRGTQVYFRTWIGTAIVAVPLIGAEALTRSRRLHFGLAGAMIVGAVEAFVPAGAAGALVGAVLAVDAPEALWMLPGLWRIMVSLGLFASARSLPRAVAIAGAWYMLSGIAVPVACSAMHALSPLAMGVPFTIGQALIAVILHQTLGAIRKDSRSPTSRNVAI